MIRVAIISGALGAFAVVGSSAANAQVADLECGAEGAKDISMSAKYEERRNGRRKFSAEFEAAPRAGFNAGQRMVVFVEGRNVGSVVLRYVAGDIQGDLNLDSNPDGGERPFPANFPDVGQNSRTTIRIAGDPVLGCRLR
jgi:hypothetical protein